MLPDVVDRSRHREPIGRHLHPRAVVVFAALALLPLLVVGSGRISLALLMVYALVVLSSVKLTGFAIRPRPDWMELTFWVFVYVFLGIAPLAQISRRQFALLDSIGHPLTEETLVRGVAIALLGTLSFMAGTRLAGRRQAPSGRQRVEFQPQRARLLGWTGIAVGLAYLAYKGPGAIFQARYDAASSLRLGESRGQSGFLPFVILRLPTVAAFALLLARISAGQARRRDRAAVAALAVFIAIVNNPISTPRFYMGTILLTALYTYGRQRPSLIRYIGPGVALALVVVFPYMDGFRRSTSFAYDLSSVEIIEPLVSGEFNMLPLLAASGDYVDVEGYSMGRQTLGTALFWVPRSAWTGKPQDTGDVVLDGLGAPLQQYNVSAILWEELYVDFGYVGVCVGFLGYGALARSIDLRSRVKGTFWFHLAPLVAGYQVFLLRGSLLPAVPKLLVLVALGSACFRFRGRPTPLTLRRPDYAS